MDTNRILVAMSGGVDSSVAAWLLQDQGFDVVGVTMKTWASSKASAEKSCCGIDDVDDARRVASILGIPFQALDMEEIFKKTVIGNFVEEYFRGRTPNPCIICNTELKFGFLLGEADRLEASKVATGHYARVDYIQGRWCLLKGRDDTRDQSYFLYNLTQNQLSRTLFPLHDLTKVEIRQIASENGLHRVAKKAESREICFVEDDYRDYLRQACPERIRPGLFVSQDGKVLGKHQGVAMYTIGQRKGLGISTPEKLYVCAIDAETNKVVLGPRECLGKSGALVSGFNWVGLAPTDQSFEAEVKIRYRHRGTPAIIHPREHDKVFVEFKAPQDSVTPGQAIVCYQDDLVLGGGVIDCVFQ